MRLVAILAACLLFTGCPASALINSYKFRPADPAVEMHQSQDEAECRMKLYEYRTNEWSNWASGAVYRDCMIAKGYEEVK